MPTSLLRRIARIACLPLVALAVSPAAAGVTVDGGLSDWGITVRDGNSSNGNMTLWGSGIATSPHGISPAPGGERGTVTRDGFTFKYHVEDTKDSPQSNGDQVGPLFGGQNYDAEFLGVGFQGSSLAIAIVSGQRPDNGFANYSPGDIRIETSVGTFGIEVGGGAGGGAAITEGSAGVTYGINGSGHTNLASPTAAPQTAGALYKTSNLIDNANWITNGTLTSPTTPVQLGGGTYMGGEADYLFTRDSFTNQHSVIELLLSLDLFAGGSPFTISRVSWSPACGNDILDVTDLVPPPPPSVPEPGSLALMGLGGLGLACRAIRRRRREA